MEFNEPQESTESSQPTKLKETTTAFIATAQRTQWRLELRTLSRGDDCLCGFFVVFGFCGFRGFSGFLRFRESFRRHDTGVK